MNCRYCQSWNAEDEHRCTRCGRRLKIAEFSTTFAASRSAPALALANRPAVVVEVDEPSPLPVARTPVPQKLIFEELHDSNVIPFESFAAHRIQPILSSAGAVPARALPNPAAQLEGQRVAEPPAPVRSRTRRRSTISDPEDLQGGLDFLVPAPQGPRTLKTQVEAVIYCDADVATPKHRAIAAAIDGGMIFVAFGLFLFAFHCMGGMFRINRQTIPFFAGIFGTLAMFYGMLWIWAGRDTVGMRCTGLRLIDFDGFPANRRCRLVRSLGTWLSFCAGGIGLLWALADEEKLAWHDHMSKTFPTLQESNSTFFRKP
jgi:uncharacterized RDD family membrane protein YckC